MNDKRNLDELVIEAGKRPEEREYWSAKLAGEIEKSYFPYDYKKTLDSKREMEGVKDKFPPALSSNLVRLSNGSDVRLFVMLTSVLIVLLHKYTGKNDLVIGAPILAAGAEAGTGFTNTVIALREQIRDDMTCKELLSLTGKTCSKAVENQGYPMEILVRELGLSFQEDDFPLFDAAIVIENIHKKSHLNHAAANMIFSFTRKDKDIHYNLEYNSCLYNALTAERIITHFKGLTEAVLANAEIDISAVDILSAAEKEQLLVEFNDTETPYPKEKTIHALFEEQAEKKPDHIAVVGVKNRFPGEIGNTSASQPVCLTYGQLNREAGSLSGILIQRGAGCDTIVGLLVERSLEMIVGILGVLKAGGAYLPIDPRYPHSRQEYMIKDSSAKLLLTARGLEKEATKLEVDKLNAETIYIEAGIRDQGLEKAGIRDQGLEKAGIRDQGLGIRQKQKTGRTVETQHLASQEPEFNVGARRAVPGTAHLHLQPAPATGLAYIMYTSGSTGESKGVMVEHRSVVRLVANTDYVELNDETRILLTGAPVFDATTFEIWGALLNGGMLFVVGNDVILDAGSLGSALSRHKINTMWLTSPLFNQLMQQDDTIFCPLRNLLVGGDVLSPSYIKKVKNKNKQLNVINGYGPTENTTFSTTCLIDKDFTGSIPIGKPIANSTAYILDKNGKLQLPGVPGELVVGGDGVARGYLNQPELTHEKFIASGGPPFCKKVGPKTFHEGQEPEFNVGARRAVPGEVPSPTSKVPSPTYRLIYKTGDLCRWLPSGPPAGGADKATYGGVIEFLGRLDQQVKIRGFRVEPEEIENHLLGHEDVKEAVVTVAGSSGEKYLCAYIVGDIDEGNDVRRYLSERVPDYMVPSYFTLLDKMPLTANGKIDRKALPEPSVQTAGVYTAPRDESEKKMAALWSGVLGIEEEKVGIDDSFFELGGHSLKATIILAKIHKVFNCKVDLRDLFGFPTIRELVEHIKSSSAEEFSAIRPGEKKEYYTLSSAQKRLYITQQMDTGSTNYNICSILRVTGTLDKVRMEQAVARMIERHESLRTSFQQVDGEPVQRVYDARAIEFAVRYHDIGSRDQGLGISVGARRAVPSEIPSPEFTGAAPRMVEDRGGLGHPEIIDSFIRPFDLSAAPLLRVGLISLEEERYILMVDMHHTVSDGTSLALFSRELTALYAGEELPPLNIQYKDYTRWQNMTGEKARIHSQEEYWVKQFDSEIPVLELPYDFLRPSIKSYEGGTLLFEIDEKETAGLNRLISERGTTLYMVLLAVYYIFLSKLSGREDIVIGTPTAGRSHADLEPLIGMFVNTLPLRNYPEGHKRFGDFLQEVKKQTLEAFENQDFQFEDLVEVLGMNREVSRSPLFDVMFSLQNLEKTGINVPGLKLIPYKYEDKTSKFDLILMGSEMGDRLSFSLQYSTSLFKKESIERFTGYFKGAAAAVSQAVLTGDDIKIADIDILSNEEKRQLLYEFNDTATAYPKERTIPELFEEQVEKNPDRIALVGTNDFRSGQSEEAVSLGPVCLTYKQFSLEIDRLADMSMRNGAGPGAIVALLARRSIEMMTAIFAILKTGSAYLPLEPESPAVRKRYMLKDSNAKLLLVTRGLSEEVDASIINNIETIFIETGRSDLIHQIQRPAATQHLESESDVGARRAVPGTAHLHLQPAPAAGPAYIIYTSGTTGKPKGILTMHHNVTRVVKDTDYIDFRSADRVLQLSNYAFDGSVFDIYGALLNGSTLVLVDEEQVSAVDRLAGLIEQEKITVFFVTTALFNTLVELKIECFANTRKVLFGGERVSVEHSKKALEYMGKGRILHVYGPTESTVYATYYPIDHIEEGAVTIPIGRPLANTSVLVLDKYSRPVPTGVQGELVIGGDGLARGYMNRPELTSDKFIASGGPPFCKKVGPKTFDERYGEPGSGVGARRAVPGEFLGLAPTSNFQLIYKTGDLVRWNREGHIEFLGRIDTQVKVRGFRIELGEIEMRLLNIPAVEEALVLAKEYKSGDRYLCAYVVAKRQENAAPGSELDAGVLREHLSRNLPHYMVPSYFTILEKMPLTANGKIDLEALPETGMPDSEVYAAPRDDGETRMRDIWSEVLGIEREKIGIDDNFFELGGHSISAAKLSYFIRREFGVNIELKEVFANPCIRELARHVKAGEIREYMTVTAVEEKEYYELSYNQKRLWVLHRLEPQSPAFNMPSMFELRHKVDIHAFKKALHRLMIRHDSLRTKFEEIDEAPVQIILKQVEIPFEEIDISTLSEAEKKEKTRRISIEVSGEPFVLTRGPLFRTTLIKLAEEKYEFIFNLHHIITDGWSMEIIKSEFLFFYEGFKDKQQVSLPYSGLQYKDFCRWSNERIEDPVFKEKSHSYWQAKLAGGIPALELPVRPGGDKEDLQGAAYMAMINKESSERLRKMAVDGNTTLFVVMFSIYIMMLYRFSKQQDIACSIISAGREHLSLYNIIGFFVNSMLFRIDVSPDESFSDFLQRMQTAVMETFQHQGYPLELVCREMKRQYPDIPVSFNMLNILQNEERPPEPFESYHIEEAQDVKFDIEPYVTDYPGGIHMYWVYRRSLFKPENIEHIVDEYIKLIDFFTGDSQRSYEDFHKRTKKKKLKRRSLKNADKKIRRTG